MMKRQVSAIGCQLALLAIFLLSRTTVQADPPFDAAGDYSLKVSVNRAKGTGTLSVTRTTSGFAVVRTALVNGKTETYAGTGTLSGKTLKATFPVTADMVDRLDFDVITNGQPKPLTCNYYFDGKGKATGRVTNPSKIGGWTFASDTAIKNSTTALSIVKPASGTNYFAGQTVAVVTNPPNTPWEVTGAAQKTSDGKLLFNGVGDVNVIAKSGSSVSDPAKLRAVGLEVIELEVKNALPIDDASAPHLSRQLGAAAGVTTAKQPAAILLGQPLQVRASVQGVGDLAEPFRVKLLAAGANGLKLAGEVILDKLAAGQQVILNSAAPLNDKVAVNALDLAWTVEAGGKTLPGGPNTGLRVYTSYKPALKNINGPSSPTTKLHYEMACTWANGTSTNVGQGSSSIAFAVDNQLRHYVHPKDQTRKLPEVLAYAVGSTPPLNYGDLPGSWSVGSSGERGVSSLYYPPLEPRKDYENYENFRTNFGWFLLDNPTHTGGRCNQQASLISDVLGTLGIKAQVHYLERRGMGKRTGRPCRNYFFAAGGSGPWNFHGLVKATMADGKEWLFDGSFSSPPHRLNGEISWAEKPGGPFIQKWGPWYYEDYGGQVPENDIPTKFTGVQ